MLLSAFILPFTGVRTLNEEELCLALDALEQKGVAPQAMLRESVVQVILILL